MKNVFCLLLCCISFFAFAEKPLIVGMELSFPPFETINTSGKPTGISVDIAYALGKYLNRPIEIDNIPYIGLIPSLKTYKVDLIISSMSQTFEREKSIAFSDPYLETGLCLLVSKKSDLQNISDADQLGRVIVVKQGTTGEIYAKEHLKKAKILFLDKEAAGVLEVVQGKADAFIYDQFSVYTNWQKNLDTTRAILTPFTIEKWAIGLRKEDTELLNKINGFLKKFREEKGFEELGDRYLKPQKEAFKKLGIPFYL